MAAGADGVIVGSALVDIVAEGTSAGSQTASDDVAEGHREDRTVAETAQRLESKAHELKRGALEGGRRRSGESLAESEPT